MTTQTTTPDTTGAPTPGAPTSGLLGIPAPAARALATGGSLLTIAATFLAWTWTSAFPGDLTVYGYPGGLQVLVLIGGALTTLLALASYDIKGLRRLTPAGADAAVKLAALATFATAWYTVLAISVELGGVVNLEPGGYLVATTSLATLLGALALPFRRPEPDPIDPDSTGWEKFTHRLTHAWHTTKAAFASGTPRPVRELPSYAEILIIVGILALGLVVFTYGIGTSYDELFVGFLILAGLGFAALNKAGLIAQASQITARHQNITLFGAFIAAALFPFTQTDDQYATLGVYILIFATADARRRHPELTADATGVTEGAIAALAETVAPQGLVAVCHQPGVRLDEALARRPRLVAVLAEIRDPGNAGTILRTADAAGAGAVVFAGDAVDPYNGKCVRASAGSVFHTDLVRDGDASAVVGALRSAGLTVLAATGYGDTDLDDLADAGGLARPTAWLFGSEAHGLPADLLAAADARVRVPLHGRAESLNLAAAAAVCLYASARALRRPAAPRP